MVNRIRDNHLEFLFVHVPKASNYYKVFDEFSFINYLPMGVFAICDLLNREGISSRITHLGLETILDERYSIADRVLREAIPVVGMSLHWHYQSFDVMDVAQKIKRARPETKIVLGGLTASRFAAEIIDDFPQIDAVIKGDAEGSIVPFARAVLEGRDFAAVPNCVWRSADGKTLDNGLGFVIDEGNLNRLDFGNFSLLDHADEYRDYFKMPMIWMNNADTAYNLKIRMKSDTMFPLALGRGCPADCSFCGGGKAAQQRICGRDGFVFRSPKSVVDTMEKAMAHGYESFLTCFDPTPNDDTFYLEWFAEIRRRKLRAGLAVECWGLPTKGFIAAFRDTARLERSYAALSPETGSEEIRKKNKAFFYYSNAQLRETMAALADAGIPTILYFTAGIPFENAGHRAETAAFAKSLKKEFGRVIDGIFCIPVQIEPGSPMFEQPDAWGVVSTRARFRDFYESHGTCRSGPFDYLGYTTDADGRESGDLERFRVALQDFRCKHFCVINPKVLGKVEIPRLSPILCKLRHKYWTRKGFGAVPAERRTFR